MRRISLTQGKYALVDDCDYEFLIRWKWYFHSEGSRGYALRHKRVNGKAGLVPMHRVVASRMGLHVEGINIDHKDNNGTHNWRSNLRLATTSQNGANRLPNRNSVSGYKGVTRHLHQGRWQAQIQVNGSKLYLGLFDSRVDAAKAYNDAALKYFGEFARLNTLPTRFNEEITND